MAKKKGASCWIVIASSGQYEDYRDRNLRVFADEAEASANADAAREYLDARSERYRELLNKSFEYDTSPDDHVVLYEKAKRILSRHPFDPDCDEIDTSYRVEEASFIGLPGVPETPETGDR